MMMVMVMMRALVVPIAVASVVSVVSVLSIVVITVVVVIAVTLISISFIPIVIVSITPIIPFLPAPRPLPVILRSTPPIAITPIFLLAIAGSMSNQSHLISSLSYDAIDNPRVADASECRFIGSGDEDVVDLF